MDQAEPQPPGQPERHRPGRPQRWWPRAPGQPSTGPPGVPAGPPGQPGTGQPSTGQPDPFQPGLERPGPDEWLDDCAQWTADHPRITETGHPVLVGYDGSEPSRHALAYAAGMARRLGRGLLIVYVTSPGVFCEPLTGQVIAALRDSTDTQRWLLAELDDVCDREGLEVRIVTRQGRPARELAAAAAEFGADALVIGAPGGLWHHVAGSVPGWLARHAQCPVIVVP